MCGTKAKVEIMRNRVRVSLALILVVALGLIGPGVAAQESATIQATATVVSSLTVTGSVNLQFDNVTPGVNKAVDKTTVGKAGEWTVSAGNGAEVTLDFTLPANLASGGNNMPITFSTTDGGYGANQATPTAINPAVVTTTNMDGSGALTIWIGGTAEPGAGQSGGAYAGDVELIVTLTGN